MPTQQEQRPFFASFLAAFRAPSTLQQQSPTKGSSSQTASSSNIASSPRTISAAANKPSGATTTALSTLHSPRALSTTTSPLSTSPEQAPSQPRYIESRGPRRGSDSSSEGFRDVLGAEKWYIGGRTATGEEKFFKLGVIRRQRSQDRLSLDRLSL